MTDLTLLARTLLQSSIVRKVRSSNVVNIDFRTVYQTQDSMSTLGMTQNERDRPCLQMLA
jgi:hypothetical protein